MNRAMSNDLHVQFQKAISMLRFTIEEFDDDQWVSGISWFQTPARVAYHTVEALDAYFSNSSSGREFDYGHRYGAPWWEMTKSQLPNREELITYLEEVQMRIDVTFVSLEDQDLSAPFEHNDWFGSTILGHIAYALRHTMHHQGALTVLSTHHGHDRESWQ